MIEKKQKIVIVGGTGFVGQGLIKYLSSELFEVHSISRHPFNGKPGDRTHYHAIALSDSAQLRPIVSDADWVIDAVGILLPNPLKNQTYQNSSYEPAHQLIHLLAQEVKPKFLFISANAGPFFMRPYLKAKLAVEREMAQALPGRAFAVYPGIIFDPARQSSYWPGVALTHLKSITYFNKFRPVARAEFAKEVSGILTGKSSPLLRRTVNKI